MSEPEEESVPSDKCPVYDHDKLVEFARDMVSDQMLIAGEGDVRAWHGSLLFFWSHIEAKKDDIGMILVPVAPHMRGRWVNGTVPGIIMQCFFINKEQTQEVIDIAQTMWDALHPELQQQEM